MNPTTCPQTGHAGVLATALYAVAHAKMFVLRLSHFYKFLYALQVTLMPGYARTVGHQRFQLYKCQTTLTEETNANNPGSKSKAWCYTIPYATLARSTASLR